MNAIQFYAKYQYIFIKQYDKKKNNFFLRSFYFDSLLFEKLDFQKYIDSKKIETEFWRSNNNIKISDLKVKEIFHKRLSKENELGNKLKNFQIFGNFLS